jgi:HAMP domain-containing protein
MCHFAAGSVSRMVNEGRSDALSPEIGDREDRAGRIRLMSTMKTSFLIIASFAIACVGFAQDAKENPKESVERLRQQAGAAKEAGRMEEAQKLHEAAERLMAELRDKAPGKKMEKAPEGMMKMEKKPGFKPGNPEQERLQHVMQAVEHLRAAGLKEPAQSIEQIAQHMRHEMEERMKQQQMAREGKPESGPNRQAELDEMRQQIRQLAEQIEKLRMELKNRAP